MVLLSGKPYKVPLTSNAVTQRQNLRRKLIDFYDSLCIECKENHSLNKKWGRILEQVLYQKRKEDSR